MDSVVSDKEDWDWDADWHSIFEASNSAIVVLSPSISWTFTLRSLLSNVHDKEPCKQKECILNNEKLCTVKNVIYEVQCKKCSETYIGSTVPAAYYVAALYVHAAYCVQTKLL